jgi:hypothetical protein
MNKKIKSMFVGQGTRPISKQFSKAWTALIITWLLADIQTETPHTINPAVLQHTSSPGYLKSHMSCQNGPCRYVDYLDGSHCYVEQDIADSTSPNCFDVEFDSFVDWDQWVNDLVEK